MLKELLESLVAYIILVAIGGAVAGVIYYGIERIYG